MNGWFCTTTSKSKINAFYFIFLLLSHKQYLHFLRPHSQKNCTFFVNFRLQCPQAQVPAVKITIYFNFFFRCKQYRQQYLSTLFSTNYIFFGVKITPFRSNGPSYKIGQRNLQILHTYSRYSRKRTKPVRFRTQREKGDDGRSRQGEQLRV